MHEERNDHSDRENEERCGKQSPDATNPEATYCKMPRCLDLAEGQGGDEKSRQGEEHADRQPKASVDTDESEMHEDRAGERPTTNSIE